jgi:hypothetical protein
VQQLMQHVKNKRAIFNVPVPVREIPTYTDVIKNPIDLKTMKDRLETGYYTPAVANAPIEKLAEDMCWADLDAHYRTLLAENEDAHNRFRADLRLIFQNALDFNQQGFWVHTAAQQMMQTLEDLFVKMDAKETIDKAAATEFTRLHSGADLHRTCSFCMQQQLKHASPVLHCHGQCNSPITTGHCYQTRDGTRQWCQRCYSRLQQQAGEKASAPRSATQTPGLWRQPTLRAVDVDKAAEDKSGPHLCLDELNKVELEKSQPLPWAQCLQPGCGRWMHQVCALYNPREVGIHARVGMVYGCAICRAEVSMPCTFLIVKLHSPK